MHNDETLAIARLLIARLERLSVDSYWAHQASGLRRSLMRCVDEVEQTPLPQAEQHRRRLERLMQRGFDILERAARELGDPGL
jgi:hypothetical protein